MSQNKRKADSNQRRNVVAVILFAICLVALLIALIQFFAEKTAPKQSSRSQAELKSPTETNKVAAVSDPMREMPPLPEDPVTLVNLGNLMLQRDRLEQAIYIYHQALKKTPDDEELHFNL